MADTNVALPYEYIPQTTRGLPLSQARIFVGNVGQDPEVPANQKTLRVRQGDGTVTTVSQPITTSEGGLPTFNNQPVQLIVDGQYSLKINDMDGNQIYFVSDSAQTLPNVNDLPGTAELITTINQNIIDSSQNSNSYTDGGIANAIQLNPIAPNTAPTAYTDRMRISFTAAAANTGNTTLRIATLAITPLVYPSGDELPADAITAGLYVEAYYDLANTRFVYIPSATRAQDNTISGAIIENDTMDGDKVIDNTLNGEKILDNTVLSTKFPAPTAGTTFKQKLLWSYQLPGLGTTPITPGPGGVYSRQDVSEAISFTSHLTGTITMRVQARTLNASFNDFIRVIDEDGTQVGTTIEIETTTITAFDFDCTVERGKYYYMTGTQNTTELYRAEIFTGNDTGIPAII